jgi:hypothetical protein
LYKWSNGSTQIYDAQFALIGRIDRNGTERLFGAKDVPRWLDLGGDLKAKREVKYGYTTTGACGRVEVTLTSTGKDIMYSLVHQGAAKEIPAVEVNFEGKWSASCGIGKQTLKAVYSPALDLLLAYETMNYQPNGFLYVGSAWSLKYLN